MQININTDLDALDESIKKLRNLYEKYFLGIDRTAPAKERDSIKRNIRRLMVEGSNNTARRFRLQSLNATFVTYESQWDRICRQIEEGTYHRDRFKAKRRIARAEEAEAAPSAQQEVAAPAAAPARETPAAVKRNEGLAKLHKAYISAAQKAGHNKSISMEALAKTVRAQTQVIKEKYNCKRVEFKVAVKNGKPILKAVPKN
jgi:hypothetical protein